MTSTAAGTKLDPGESILLSAKISYSLKGTSQSAHSYPRNYTDTSDSAGWTAPSFAGSQASGSASAFFTAYAKVVGGVNGDLKVNIIDLATVARAFGSKPGAVNWNPDADLDKNGIIDIRDLSIVAFYFGA